ncbi:gamma-glutamylcyclotransferase isoform X2 [Tribolium castaneum]|uniref:gamma-glutamylcyclotransferase n=1 Tax=Tribolium castaneum TaxID=7070 RepID=D6X2L3_TRICA|nr:PREDICTED: gamma-glutamylcyclotransferase isoform X2 [Tribolium castaneum]EFA09461.1 Gamma-glutamylcyclotransferase-like Protein [Tribolium castaneum]|eukprot:XP_968935.1 PREDICTED: gamma-glutamylcyclotransferase isoform X2 [Tribolium castaneum]
MGGTFLYFAYGSNLLAKRIHINNPSAVRVGIGKLMNYQLDFLTYSERWHGASATIVKNDRRHVWGAIWEIDLKHMESLDRQEGVPHKIYYALDVDVIVPEGGTKKCRVYQQCVIPSATEDIEKLADDRKPSAVYLNIIKEGAKESNLPEEYQKFLHRIPDNGYNGEVDIGIKL